MTWGLSAHRVTGGEPEVDRLRFERIADARGPGTPSSAEPLHVQSLLALHRHAGNAAVAQLLRRDRSTAPEGAAAVQRQDDEEEAGQSWATDETASQSSGGDYSTGEVYGPPAPPIDDDGGGQSRSSGEAAPAQEPPTGGEGGGSGGAESGGGGGEPAPAEDGGGSSWWSGEESPGQEEPSGAGGGGGSGGGGSGGGGDDGGGSSWWPFGSGEETPRNPPGEAAPGGDDGGGSSWWPFGGGDETPRNAPGESGDEDPSQRSQEDIDAKIAEGESGSEKDEFVPMGGGPHPIAMAGGFHDDGNAGIVPVGSRDATEDPAEAMHPHAFIRGGATGTVTWAGGGGEGKGPKGNQDSGSLQSEIEPDYDYHWGGPFTNASAYIKPSTGVIDVHRSFTTSAAGDQGNGWWVSQAAAAALVAHEQKHVARSKANYDRIIAPMETKIADAATYGKEKAYRGSVAKAELRAHIDWAATIKKFKAEDISDNAPNNLVDNEDIGAAHYPFSDEGPRTIEGKEYKFYTYMKRQGEQPPP